MQIAGGPFLYEFGAAIVYPAHPSVIGNKSAKFLKIK